MKNLVTCVLFILATSVWYESSAQRPPPPASPAGGQAANPSNRAAPTNNDPGCEWIEKDDFCKTTTCTGMCKKEKKKDKTFCRCSGNGCKYSSTVETGADGVAVTKGKCEGTCSDFSNTTGRVAIGVGNVFSRAVSSVASGGYVSAGATTKSVCVLIDSEPESHKRGNTGCDCRLEVQEDVRNTK